MKKNLFSLVLLTSSLFLAEAARDRDFAIPYDQLPAAAKTFVTTHFANQQVAFCVRDTHSYEVRLADAAEIEFNLDGSAKEVDCKYKEIPSSVTGLLPKEIPSYVKATFPNAIITKVHFKVWGYELELNNGLELEFNATGKLLKIDD